MASAGEKYRYHVHDIVTNNASSMEKMRGLLREYNDDLIVYGCSSHYLNLFGQSLTPQMMIKHIADVEKYFKYYHTPSAHLNESSNSVKPQLVNFLPTPDEIVNRHISRHSYGTSLRISER